MKKQKEKFPFHKHSKGQLTYTEGGIAYVHVEDKTYVIPARHYVWIPAGREHYLQIKHTATAIRTIYFYNDNDDKDSFYTQLGIYPVNQLLLEMINYSERWNGNINPEDKGYRFLAAIRDILPEISKKSLPFSLPTTQNERLRPIINFIAENYSRPLTLEGISREFALSERTLSRLFRSLMGISFLQYMKSFRMVKAIEMILQTDRSISEIAYEVGYNSVSAFSNTFCKLTGMRPTDFEK